MRPSQVSEPGNLKRGSRAAEPLLCQKSPHKRCDLVDLLVEREVPGIEDMKLRAWNLALIGEGSGDRKGGIIPAPDNEHRRLMLAHPSLPGGVGGDIGLVVVEKIGLNFGLPRTGEMGELIEPKRWGRSDRCWGLHPGDAAWWSRTKGNSG